MDQTPIGRPDETEYAPYYGKYIGRVPEGDILAQLASQLAETLALLRGLTPGQAGHRYAPGKWSIKQVVGHMIDTERIFAYRALRFARNDQTPLPGFEQDDYMAAARFDERALGDLTDELALVRRSSLALFRPLDESAWQRRGVASGVTMSVRALAWAMAGHEIHHREILVTKYL
jgi:uncharacterized damage-inducible protein DinB